MRRTATILLVFAALACTKNAPEGNDGQLISMSSGLEVKASSSKLDSTIVFGTYAWKTSGTWAATADAQKLSSPYMVNVETAYDAKAGDWKPGSYRWPTTSSYLHFACYAPYKASTPMSFSLSDGICFAGYTVGEEDLLYSDFIQDRSSATHAQVPIAFHHALGQVVIKVKKDDVPTQLSGSVASTIVTLDTIKIVGLKNVGSFRQKASPQWSSISGNSEVVVFAGSKTLTTTADQVKVFYVLPQTFEAGVQKIHLKYSVKINYTNSTSTSNTPISETHDFSSLGLSQTWAVGKSVQYTITVSAFGGSVSFGGSTSDWTEQPWTGNY